MTQIDVNVINDTSSPASEAGSTEDTARPRPRPVGRRLTSRRGGWRRRPGRAFLDKEVEVLDLSASADVTVAAERPVATVTADFTTPDMVELSDHSPHVEATALRTPARIRAVRTIPRPPVTHTGAAITLAGCLVDLVTQDRCLDLVAAAAERRIGPALAVASANLDHVTHFGTGGTSRGTALFDTTAIRWMTLLDGAPLAARAERMTGAAWPRLAGSDLLEPILERAARDGHRVGFLGGSPEMLQLLRDRLAVQRPDLLVAGTWSPARNELGDRAASQRLADEVAYAGVDILVVGLGKPRQEAWIQAYGSRTGARVLLAFGASADFLAGTVNRAPEWVREEGLEWAYRLATEPRRLYRRYLVEGPKAMTRLMSDRSSRPLSERVTSTRRIAKVTVVVVTYNSAQELPALLASLPASATGLALDVVVVDNGSRDATVELARAAGVTLVESGANLGFAGGINLAMEHVADDTDAIAILNPDLVLAPGSLMSLASMLIDPGVGVAVPKILNVDGTRFPSIRRDATIPAAIGDALFGARLRGRPTSLSDTDWDEASYTYQRDVEWASGAAWLVARDVALAVGPWNTSYFLYSEEVEYARRVRAAGYRLRYSPDAVVTHVGGASGRSVDLDTLQAVNRIVDYTSTHGLVSSTAFRGVVTAHHALRASFSKVDRAIATTLVRNRRLPQWRGPDADR